MKKTVLFALSCLLFAIPMKAQQNFNVVSSERPVALSIVPNAGLNLSSFTGGDSGTRFSMRAGANAGVGAELRFIKRNEHTPVIDGLLGVYVGASFEMGGTKASGGNGISMLNVGIPVLVKVYPLKWLFIEAGPEFFLNISNSPNTTTIGNLEMNVGAHKANDLKIGVGAGVKFANFGIGARYLIGTSKFASSAPWKCNILQINLSYSIPVL